MSPERITGKIKIDYLEAVKRADVWSVGVIIFVLFAGRMPFAGETCQELYNCIKKGDFMFAGNEWEHVP